MTDVAWVNTFIQGGAVVVLTYVVFAFVRGDIISRIVFDRVLQMYEKQLAQLAEQYLQRLDKMLDLRKRERERGERDSE